MSALFKYAIVLASGFAIGAYVHGPVGFEQVAKLARTDGIDIVINNTVAHLRPEAAAIVVDPADARRVDEDLDYLIAKRIGTLEGWQAFLAAHASGAHAESAKAEIDKRSLLVKASEPAAAEVSDRVSPEAKVESEKVETEAVRPAPPSAAAAPPLNEVCDHDRDCPGRSRSDPSSDETPRMATDSEPGKLRPQVASLTDSLSTAAAEPTMVGPDLGSKPRAAALRRGTTVALHRGTTVALHRETTVSSHIVPRPRKHLCVFGPGCQWKPQTLPPILQAILGVKTRHSTRAFGLTLADARR